MPLSLEDAIEVARTAASLGRDIGDALVDQNSSASSFAAAFLARGYQSLNSATILSSLGFEADAMSATRTITELAVDLAYIRKDDSDVRMELFMCFEDIANLKVARAISKLHDGKVDENAMSVLATKAQNARKLHPPRGDGKLPEVRDWAGNSIATRAENVGLANFYGTSYRDSSAASHSGAATMRYVVEVDGDDHRLIWGPGRATARPIQLAIIAYLMLAKVAIDSFELAAFAEKYSALAGRLPVPA